MPDGLTICFVGDSFINGTGDLTFDSLGVWGETSVDIARRWLPEVRPRLQSAGSAGHIVFSLALTIPMCLRARLACGQSEPNLS